MKKRQIITILFALVAMTGLAKIFKTIKNPETIAVGTGTWGIAAVIPKYLSLRLLHKTPEHLFRLSPRQTLFRSCRGLFVGLSVTL